MAFCILLAVWALFSIVFWISVLRFAPASDPSDDTDDWTDEQARRAEWARRQIEKIESERQQAESAQRWKREVDPAEGESGCKLWNPNLTVSNGGSYGPPPDWQGTLARVKKIMLECQSTSFERFSIGPYPIAMRINLRPGEYRNPFHFLNEFDQWFEFNRRDRFEKEST
jgi:hypothetical protein